MSSSGRTYLGSTTPAAVSSAGSAGSALTAAPIDHVHAQQSVIVGPATDPGASANQLTSVNLVAAWAWINVSGGTPSLVNSYNVDSITDLGTGYIQVVWDRNVDLNGGQPTGAPIGQTYSDGGLITEITASANTDAQFRARDYSLGNLTDPLGWSVILAGRVV